ncbi:MAG: HAMP domain-containing sensor histidine kinase [Anaerolineae bacterium]
MTHPFYLTPASISFLAQFILSLSITIFLALRLRSRDTALILLTCFFAGATTFIGLMFLDAVLLPYPRLLWAVYAENAVLALMLVFLLQFAYRFPQHYPQHKWEARAGLVVSLAYFLWEAGYMIYRYVSLLGHDTVYFRPFFSIYLMGIVLALPPIAFLRQCIAADARPVSWLHKLWKPEGKGARGARAFVGVFGILFLMGVANVALTVGLPNTVYNAILSIGILVSLWLFASNYINFAPGGVGVQTKLLVLTLTLVLALLGSVGWFIAPPYIRTFQPNLSDHQTLRFTPDGAGGYDVEEVAFFFESELGERLPVPHGHEVSNYEVDFHFPFYGQAYDEVYVSSYGTLVMGEPFWEPNMQTRGANFPAIFPLMIDLDPDPSPDQGGGLYARLDPEAGRLIVTWDHLPVFSRPHAVFTFQVQLYQDGVFQITYDDLSLPFLFDPDASPRENPWLRGIVAGQGEPLHTNAADLLTTARIGGAPLIENYHLAFRHYLHDFMQPLATILIGGSILLSIALPLLMRLSIVRPLESLTAGVRQLEAGDLSIELPIQNEDEIGYLTGAFNTMAARLGDLIHNLEARVAERTEALHRINDEMALQLQEIQARNEELDAFARTVAHDIKNPLSTISGYAGFLVENGQQLPPEEIADFLNIVDRNAAHLARVVDALLLLARVRQQEVPLEPVDMGPMLDRAVARLSGEIAASQAEVILPPNGTWPRALGYAPWIEEIWINYLGNGCRYGGCPPRRELGGEMLAGGRVRFWVRDHGPGIAPEDQARLFTPFTQLAPGRSDGHGLGLSIVRRIADKLGGQAGVESAPGQGSLFYFTLPAAPGADADGGTQKGADEHGG